MVRFEVCAAGSIQVLNSLEECLKLRELLKEHKVGSDIWVGDKLHSSCIYNAKTGEFETTEEE